MIRRLAYISIHTCPLEQPGFGYSGGMNVYIKELAQTMAARGIEVQVFTRRADDTTPTKVEVVPGFEVIHIEAGPRERLPVSAIPDLVGEFSEGVVRWAYTNGATFDVVHSHYWLSGWAGVLVKGALDIPLVNSFHTLGKVKDATRRPGEPPESLLRIATEDDVIDLSNCVVASTPAEAEDLIDHYHADPAKLCVSPPGIDHEIFRPGDKAAARTRLGLGDGPIALFVGRVQPLKGLDIAVAAVGELADRFDNLSLVVVGGPSGSNGEAAMQDARDLGADLQLGDAVQYVAPQPHEALADYYRAADVLLVPSRNETFGLVVAEAQACGLPVVASNVGGLAHALADGETGFLIDGFDPTSFAVAAAKILGDPTLGDELGAAGVELSEKFSWPATADRLLQLYGDYAVNVAG